MKQPSFTSWRARTISLSELYFCKKTSHFPVVEWGGFHLWREHTSPQHGSMWTRKQHIETKKKQEHGCKSTQVLIRGLFLPSPNVQILSLIFRTSSASREWENPAEGGTHLCQHVVMLGSLKLWMMTTFKSVQYTESCKKIIIASWWLIHPF